jgi:hypothetical protein
MADTTSGTLVGSILESAGYIYQSAILDKLADPLTNSVGGLIYLLGIAIVIFQLAVLKQSKGAMWLFIGPPLFLVCITTRDPLPHARWEFGSNPRDQQQVEDGIATIADGASNPSRVFGRYVKMISPVVSEVVDKINGSQGKNDLWFLFKGEVFSMLGARKIEDEGLRYLIQYGLMGECHQVIDAARTITDPLRRVRVGAAQGAGGTQDADIQAAKEKFDKLVDQKKHFMHPDKVREYIAKLDNANGRANTDDNFLDEKKQELRGSALSCQDIWQLILEGVILEAKAVEEEIDKDSRERDLDPNVIKSMVAQANGLQSGGQLHSENAQAAVDINRLIAGYLLRNEMREPDMGALIGKFISRTELRTIDTRLMGGENAQTEYARIGLDEWSEKERLIHTALSLPYYQGLGLYFLGITFPFFALLLLIPGKAQGFLMWFMLWLWVKTWDIGFAIVMKLDTLFWGLFISTKDKIAAAEGSNEVINDNDLFITLAALDRLDPTFQAGTYYTLIGACLAAIPIVSAQLVLGATNSGASLVSEGMSKYSEFFSSAKRSFIAQDIVYGLKSEALSLQEQRGLMAALTGDTSSTLVNPDSPLGKYESRLNPNPVTPYNPQRSLGISGVFTTSPRSAFPGKNADSRYEEAIRAAQKSAFAGGLNRPFQFHDSKTSGLIDRAARLFTARDRHLTKAQYETEVKNLKTDIDAEVKDANWQASIERKAYELHKGIARFGGIPVPWSNNPEEEGSAQEFQRHIARFNQRVELLKSTIALSSEYADEAIDGSKKVIDGWKNWGWSTPDTSGVAGMYNTVVNNGGFALGALAPVVLKDISPQLKRYFEMKLELDDAMAQEEKDKEVQNYLSQFPPQVLDLILRNGEPRNFFIDPFGRKQENREDILK